MSLFPWYRPGALRSDHVFVGSSPLLARVLVLVATAAALGCGAGTPAPLTAPLPPDSTSPARGNVPHPPNDGTVDLTDGLSVTEAVVLSVLHNPSLKAARSRRAIAGAQVFQAGILPNPELAVGLEQPTAGTTAGTVPGYSVELQWEVTSLFGTTATRRAARARRASVDLEVANAEWTTAQQARVAVYRLASSLQQRTLTAGMQNRLDDDLVRLRKAFAGKLVTEIRVTAAQTAADQNRLAVAALDRQIAQQRIALNRILGREPGAALRLEATVKLPDRISLPPAAGLLAGLKDRRLDLLALARAYDSQRASYRASVLRRFPRVAFGVGGARDTGNVITTNFSVTIGLPLFDRNQGNIAAERASRDQVRAEYKARVAAARADVAAGLADVAALNGQIAARRAMLPAQRRLVRIYRNAVRQRQADVESYYAAWNELTMRRVDIIKLRQELIERAIQLEVDTGRYGLFTAAHRGNAKGTP